MDCAQPRSGRISRGIKLLTAACAVLACCGSSRAAFVDFDTLPSGGTVAAGSTMTTAYSSLGVTFSGIEKGSTFNPAAVSGNYSGSHLSSFGNYLSNVPDNGLTTRFDILRLSFSSPAKGVSFNVDTRGALSVTLSAYNAAGTVVETQTVTNQTFKLVTFTNSAISRIDGAQPTDTWAWGLDNLTFTVPEPAMPCAVMVAGVIALRRRRKP